MPNVNCCVPYCCADSKRHRGVRFYTLPKDRERRQAWICQIRNINLRTTSRYTSVCSLHFPGGAKNYDTKDPSLFPWSPQWPAIVQEYNNRLKVCHMVDLTTSDSKRNRPMTLRIPPMCPWASQFNEYTSSSSKSLNDFYSPKTLQVDPHDLQEITSSNPIINDFFSTVEAECQKIKNEPLEPTTHNYETKPDISISLPIEDNRTTTTNPSSTMNNKNLHSTLDFYSPSPLSSELLLQTPVNNNHMHSTLYSTPSATENLIKQEVLAQQELAQQQTEAELLRRRTLLMSEHYNRKARQEQHEAQKEVLAPSSTCSSGSGSMQIYPTSSSSQIHQTNDFHQNLQQTPAKKSLPAGERNVAKSIRKAVNAPTHSYVIHKHQGSMLSNMADLWKKGKLCDATIGNGNMKIMVHKIVLVALSPQLLSLPNTNLTFPQEIGGDALWAFAKYMYEGVVSLNVDVLEDMERISKILNLQDLQDMCKLYRQQVNLPNNTSLSRSSNTRDPGGIDLDALQPSVSSEPASNEVSFFSLPSGDITQTVSRPVQHLQILSNQLPYSSNRSPARNRNLSAEDRSCITISPSGSDSDCTVVTSSVKQEPSSPLGQQAQYRQKDFLSSLPSRQSQNRVFVQDNLSERWQPRSYSENDDIPTHSPHKQLRLTDQSQRNDPQTFKIELSGSLDPKQNEAPYPISLIPANHMETT